MDPQYRDILELHCIPIQEDKGELTNIIISAIHLKILTEIC